MRFARKSCHLDHPYPEQYLLDLYLCLQCMVVDLDLELLGLASRALAGWDPLSRFALPQHLLESKALRLTLAMFQWPIYNFLPPLSRCSFRIVSRLAHKVSHGQKGTHSVSSAKSARRVGRISFPPGRIAPDGAHI